MLKWEQLLSAKRCRGQMKKEDNLRQKDLRSEFEKDYHRIIGSASFRRLQDKTQVFPLDKSDFIRTRLTHSLEVSSFAKSLGQNIGESILTYKKDPCFTAQMKEDIGNILQCAGLIHDIGNPPFGHFGEIAIREWFERNLPVMQYHGKPLTEILTPQMQQDLYKFEGNAQALRLVTKLHFLVDENGMDLTYGLLGTIIKYPVSSLECDRSQDDIKKKKPGYYYADREMFQKIQEETGTEGKRHPLTFILEAADDIAYTTADIEDAYVKGFITYQDLNYELGQLEEKQKEQKIAFQPLQKLNQLYVRGREMGLPCPEEYAIKNWIIKVQSFLIQCATSGFAEHYDEIMEGTYTKDLFYETEGEGLMRLLGDFAHRQVFTSQFIYGMEVYESVMLDYLMDRFVTAVLKYDDPKQNPGTIEKRLISFISNNYKNAYHVQAKGKEEAEKVYLRLLLATDTICGMTDSYAKRLYQEMKAIV